jgi:carbohydrate diacid regulator
MDKRVKNAFFEEWLINDGYKNFDDLRERGKSLGIDIDKPGRIIIVSIDELDEYKDNQEGQSVIAKFENNVAAQKWLQGTFQKCVKTDNSYR